TLSGPVSDPAKNDGGFEVIKKHKEHIAAYGEGNERHETADINTFLWGVANR
uniref:Glutamine synthetase (Fragments) n=1 Tax=Vitis sp. TaxID=3604 RepID=GLNA_VITSX|nr:RecName: Full=Glutamine synthetase; AltName: Full=Glutamate--ammonia ligase [Vitis sp.]